MSAAVAAVAAVLLFAVAEAVTHPRAVPPEVAGDVRAGLVLRASALEKRAAALDTRIAAQASGCGAVSSQDPEYAAKVSRCTKTKGEIEREWAAYDDVLASYHADLDRILAPPPPMPEAAALLVKALEDASAEIQLPKIAPPANPDKPDLRCQDFFRAIGRRLDARKVPSWNASIAKLTSANAIAREIAADSEHWRALKSMDDAQALADRGVIVVGASVNAKGHGHLGFVQPAPPGLDLSKFAAEGTGPFVRDGNRHTYGPSTWGAIRASRAFTLADTTWYVWIPSE